MPWLRILVTGFPPRRARVRSQFRSCVMCTGQSITAIRFLQVHLFPLPILIPSAVPHSLIIILSNTYRALLNNQHMPNYAWDHCSKRGWEDSVKTNILRRSEHRNRSIKYILNQCKYIPSKHGILERATKFKSRLWKSIKYISNQCKYSPSKHGTLERATNVKFRLWKSIRYILNQCKYK
jgi:hypothetical protein